MSVVSFKNFLGYLSVVIRLLDYWKGDHNDVYCFFMTIFGWPLGQPSSGQRHLLNQMASPPWRIIVIHILISLS